MATKGPRVSGSVEHWLDLVEASVHQCAEHRAGRGDVFLWNARRIQEAVLYALGQKASEKAWESAKGSRDGKVVLDQFAQKLVEEGLLHQAIEPYLLLMRRTGNLGVHAQEPTKPLDSTSLNECTVAIARTVRWAFLDKDSPIARPMPPKVSEAVRDLESLDPRVPPELKAARRILDLEAQLSAAVLVRDEPNELFDGDLGPNGLQRVLVRAKRERAWVLAFAVSTAVALISLTLLVMRSWAPAVETESHNLQPTRSPPALAAARCPECPAIQACPALPHLVPTDVVSSAPQPTPRAALPGSPRPAGEAEPNVQAAPTAVATPADRPKPNPCPDGTTYVPAAKLHFARGPHPRKDWPKPEPMPSELKVAAHCLQDRPVAYGTFRAWVDALADDSLKARIEKATPAGNANVHDWSVASRYCHEAGGNLPAIAQYETAMKRNAKIVGPASEWAADTYPPAAFGYQATSVNCSHSTCSYMLHMGPLAKRYSTDPWLTWNRAIDGKTKRKYVAFRCAFAAKEAD